MSEVAMPRGWSERRRSIYPGIDSANDFAEWLNARLAKLPEIVRPGAVMVCTPLEDGAFMVGVRHANTDSN